MHLEKRCYDVARIAIFYEFVCDIYIAFVAFFFDYSLDIFIQLIFFLFDNSLDIWYLTFFDVDLVYLFDVGHFPKFTRSDKGDCRSFFACPAGSADSMCVSFSILWYRIIDDMGHIVDIDTSRCDVCSYEYLHFFVFETLEKMFSLFLSEIAMQSFCTISLVV